MDQFVRPTLSCVATLCILDPAEMHSSIWNIQIPKHEFHDDICNQALQSQPELYATCAVLQCEHSRMRVLPPHGRHLLLKSGLVVLHAATNVHAKDLIVVTGKIVRDVKPSDLGKHTNIVVECVRPTWSYSKLSHLLSSKASRGVILRCFLCKAGTEQNIRLYALPTSSVRAAEIARIQCQWWSRNKPSISVGVRPQTLLLMLLETKTWPPLPLK
jgi:hypothetical protein